MADDEGGLGRIDEDISKKLVSGAKKGSLSIDRVQSLLEGIELESQKLLLNTLGGECPMGSESRVEMGVRSPKMFNETRREL